MIDIFNKIAEATKPQNAKIPTNKETYLKFKKIDSNLKKKVKKVDKILKNHLLWIDKNFYSVYDAKFKKEFNKFLDCAKLSEQTKNVYKF